MKFLQSFGDQSDISGADLEESVAASEHPRPH
jgi:hypothetical protein